MTNPFQTRRVSVSVDALRKMAGAGELTIYYPDIEAARGRIDDACEILDEIDRGWLLLEHIRNSDPARKLLIVEDFTRALAELESDIMRLVAHKDRIAKLVLKAGKSEG